MRGVRGTLLLVAAGLIATATSASILERSGRALGTHAETAVQAMAGERYSGDYRDGKYNGRGILVYANGEKYTGEFRDNLRNGRGIYTWPDGRRYVGEFHDGQPNGQGRFTLANGEEYVGTYSDNRREGQGIYSWPDRRRYDGEFHNNLPHGRGVLTLAGGQRQIGLFWDGEYIGEDLAPSRGPAAALQPASTGVTEVSLRRNGINFTTTALLNGSVECEFFVDSGAADVLVPMDVFDALLKAGTISQKDVTGLENYRMANGSSMKAVTFRIATLKVGSILLENVRGSVGERSGPALLGMSFLTRFKSWTLDNRRQVLILD
jgi:clan AA aspartic protease (TIGR02281 family)